MSDQKECSCGEGMKARIFFVDEFQIRAFECPKCGKIFLEPDDVTRYAEYKKGINVAERVVC